MVQVILATAVDTMLSQQCLTLPFLLRMSPLGSSDRLPLLFKTHAKHPPFYEAFQAHPVEFVLLPVAHTRLFSALGRGKFCSLEWHAVSTCLAWEQSEERDHIMYTLMSSVIPTTECLLKAEC